MKVVFKNVNLEFAVNDREEVSMRFGNDVQGMTLNAFLSSNGGTTHVSEANYAVTPYINIENAISAITLTQALSPYDGQCQVAFYSSQNESSYISKITGGQSVVAATKTIQLADIPSTAKYLRFNAAHGSDKTSSASDASTITFIRSLE